MRRRSHYCSEEEEGAAADGPPDDVAAPPPEAAEEGRRRCHPGRTEKPRKHLLSEQRHPVSHLHPSPRPILPLLPPLLHLQVGNTPGNRDKDCPFCILERQIARSLNSDSPATDGGPLSPIKINKCITLFAEHFRWGYQEDAHEFLRYVIDACLALLKHAKKTAISKDPKPSGSSVMREIFGGAQCQWPRSRCLYERRPMYLSYS